MLLPPKPGVHLSGTLEKGIPALEGGHLENHQPPTPQATFHAKTSKAKNLSLGKSLTEFLPHFLHLSNKQDSFCPFLFFTVDGMIKWDHHLICF